MSPHALVYARVVVAVGCAALAAAALLWRPANLPVLVTCLALAALFSVFKVRLPGLTGTISPAFVFVLIAVDRLTGPETILIGAVSALIQSLWRATSPPTTLQTAFNVAAVAISAGLAHSAAHAFGSAIPRVLLHGLAALVMLAVNTMLVAVMLCLLEEMPLRRAWRALQLWSVPYYLAGAVLAASWTIAPLAAGISLAVMAALSAYLLNEPAERRLRS